MYTTRSIVFAIFFLLNFALFTAGSAGAVPFGASSLGPRWIEFN